MPSYFPENNTPNAQDNERRSLQKINDLLGDGALSNHKVVNSNDASGGIDITDAPTAGLKRVLVDLFVSSGAAINVSTTEETSGTVMHGPIYLAANQSVLLSTRATPLSKLATADKKYRLTASGAGNITVETWSFSEA